MYNIGLHKVYSREFFAVHSDAAYFTWHSKEATKEQHYYMVLLFPAEISHCCQVQTCKRVANI
jgi:hypothetical protein